MSSNAFIPVFIDAKPAETLDPTLKQTICFVGIMCSDMKGVRKVKAYKNTGTKKKIQSAKRIIDHLQSKKIEVDPIGYAGKTDGQFIEWACSTINRARKMLGASWEIVDDKPENLDWKEHKFHRSTILGLSLYASILPLFGLRAEILTNKSPYNRIKLCLDRLPLDSDAGMEIMKEMGKEAEIAQMWNENVERGAEFEIGTFFKYTNAKGTWSPAKSHPCMILVDWFAVSCMANINPQQLQQEGGFNSNEIEILAKIWTASETPISTPIRDLDAPTFIKMIKEHEKSKIKEKTEKSS